MTMWDKSARNARRIAKRNKAALGYLVDKLMVQEPKQGELVIFISDGTVGVHEFVLAGASEDAMVMQFQALLQRLKGPVTPEVKSE